MEPAARLTLRLFRTKQLIVEASGFVGLVPDVARKDRVMISVPLGTKGLDLKLSIERTLLPAWNFGPDGETRRSLGELPVQSLGIQVGARG